MGQGLVQGLGHGLGLVSSQGLVRLERVSELLPKIRWNEMTLAVMLHVVTKAGVVWWTRGCSVTNILALDATLFAIYNFYLFVKSGQGQEIVQRVRQGCGQVMVWVKERVCASYISLASTLCALYLLLQQSWRGWINAFTTIIGTTTPTVPSAIPLPLPPLHQQQQRQRQDPNTRSARQRALALVCIAVVAAWVTRGLSFHGLRSEGKYASPLVCRHIVCSILLRI